VPAVHIFNI